MDRLTVVKDDDGWHIVRTAGDGVPHRSEVYGSKAEAVEAAEAAEDGTYQEASR